MNRPLNNSDFDAIDERLLSLRDGLPDPVEESELQQRMRRHWQSLDERPRLVGAWRQWLPKMPTRTVGACAAAALAACVAWVLIPHTTGTSEAVYAQVLAALREAKTIHAKGGKLKDGKLIDVKEIWCDAELGIREDFGEKGFRLDDGVFEWVYRSDGNFVIKGASRDPKREIEKMLDPVPAMEFLRAERNHTLDAEIEQVECRAFVGASGNSRAIFWLDGRNRLVRYEEQNNRNRAWTADDNRLEMRYDVSIADEMFDANFPPNARLINRTGGLDLFWSAQALPTAERLGIVLTIHDVRRVDDDTVYVMSTSRPSEEVIQRIGKVKRARNSVETYGKFAWATNGRRKADGSLLEGLRPLVVASWIDDGIDYQWVLLRNAKSLMSNGNQLPVGFHVSADNEWESALQADQKPTHLSNALDVLTLDVPAKSQGLATVLAHIQAQTLTMGDASPKGAPSLQLRPLPYSDEEVNQEVVRGIPRDEAEKLSHFRTSQPQDISLNAWVAEVLAMIASQVNPVVELIGIERVYVPDGPMWRPDGSIVPADLRAPLADQNPRNPGHGSHAPDYVTYAFVFLVKNAPPGADPGHWNLRFGEQSGSASLDEMRHSAELGGEIVRLVAHLPSTMTETDVRYSFRLHPGRNLLRWQANGVQLTQQHPAWPADLSAPRITKELTIIREDRVRSGWSSRGDQPGTRVTMRGLPGGIRENWEYELVAIDRDGADHPALTIPDRDLPKSDNQVYDFIVLPERIETFELRGRSFDKDFHAIEFRRVALRPQNSVDSAGGAALPGAEKSDKQESE